MIAHRPQFALIVGGQPNQFKTLEQEGIATNLHVPSPGLLRIFLDQGVRRFVFEGRESGGHVGPLCGFVLWDTMIEVFLEFLKSSKQPQEYHVLFAGGIHDALSAAMVAVLSAALVEKGVRVGVQLGSAYLFTEEAVESGAIVRKYVDEAIHCKSTTILQSGPGHMVRCLDNPFEKSFKEERSRLSREGVSPGEIQTALEHMKLGRLRVASKGLVKTPEYSHTSSASMFVPLSEEEQGVQGLYMIGQLSALRDKTLSIAELHHEIAVGGSQRIDNLKKSDRKIKSAHDETRPSDIAIIGMACLLPKAPNLQRFWENILNKVNSIGEIPPERWDWKRYFSSDGSISDKICSKWGAFIEDIHFDPLHYGLPPKSLSSSIEPLQLLSLEMASKALEDAGYKKRPFPRGRAAVILGISGVADLAHLYCYRSTLPMFFDESTGDIISRLRKMLPEWTEDSFPGILPNVTAGRIANRLNLGGTNFVVDGACASSLAAVYLAVKELETRTSDLVLVGGADAMQNPFTYLCFSNTQALSPQIQP